MNRLRDSIKRFITVARGTILPGFLVAWVVARGIQNGDWMFTLPAVAAGVGLGILLWQSSLKSIRAASVRFLAAGLFLLAPIYLVVSYPEPLLLRVGLSACFGLGIGLHRWLLVELAASRHVYAEEELSTALQAADLGDWHLEEGRLCRRYRFPSGVSGDLSWPGERVTLKMEGLELRVQVGDAGAITDREIAVACKLDRMVLSNTGQ
jgi:pterin-4a-carbinolamine dehydratase